MLGNLSYAAVQTDSQGKRFVDLGMEKDRLSVTGSIKFDLQLPADLDEKRSANLQKIGPGRLILVAGSTHKGEEEALLQSCQQISKDHPQLLLVLAPRHPHRFRELESLLNREGISYVNFSSAQKCNPDTRVLLIDVLGELLYFYNIADIAFIGGSLVPVGGHNLMEAAAFGLPLLMGKHIRNVEDIANQFAENGSLLLVDRCQLTKQIRSLVENPKASASRGASALEVMDRNRGALDRVEAIIYRYL
jgi:3-deoxy-D-manno-octulosonic-acid transferase